MRGVTLKQLIEAVKAGKNRKEAKIVIETLESLINKQQHDKVIVYPKIEGELTTEQREALKLLFESISWLREIAAELYARVVDNADNIDKQIDQQQPTVVDHNIANISSDHNESLSKQQQLELKKHRKKKHIQSLEQLKRELNRNPRLNIMVDNLSEKVRSDRYYESILFDESRSDVLDRLERLLYRTEKRSAVLVGPAGTGKTTFVELFARKALDENVYVLQFIPSALIQAAMLLNASSGGMLGLHNAMPIAMQELLEFIKQYDNVFLFIDEIHSLHSLGHAMSISLLDILKPDLARGEILLIGATTEEEYAKFMRDKAIRRRLEYIPVKEADKQFVKQVIQRKLQYYIYELSERYKLNIEFRLTDREWQKLLERIAETSKVVIGTAYPDCAVELADRFIAQIAKQNRNSETIELDFRKTIEYLELTIQSQSKKQTILTDITKFKQLESELADIIPNDYIRPISRALFQKLYFRTKKPLVMLFYGPTGTGKSYAAEQLSEKLNLPLIRYNMEKFTERHTAMSLFGAPPSYVGFGEATIVDRLKTVNGRAIVLLDEIEKAHPILLQTLLNALDSGIIQDNKGDEIRINDVIWIFTTNVGSEELIKRTVGFEQDREQHIQHTFDPTRFRQYLAERFTLPEIVNRIDILVPFLEELKKTISRIPDVLKDRLSADTLEQLLITETVALVIAKRTKETERTINFRAIMRAINEIVQRILDKAIDEQIDYIETIRLWVEGIDARESAQEWQQVSKQLSSYTDSELKQKIGQINSKLFEQIQVAFE